MDYEIRKAGREDLPAAEEIYANARRFMAEHGNPNQWGKIDPPREVLEEDIRQGNLYVLQHQGKIHGVFYFALGEDSTYRVIEGGAWASHTPYGTIHRIASDGSGGILAAAVAFGRERIAHLRMDTHRDNYIMQKALEKQGFCYRGIIHVANGSERLAYEWIANK